VRSAAARYALFNRSIGERSYYTDGGPRSRLPNTAHTSRPWRIRIHEIAPDFELEDVWALPTPEGPEDFPRLMWQMSSGGPSFSPPLHPSADVSPSGRTVCSCEATKDWRHAVKDFSPLPSAINNDR
jgi:hypothetical protein